MNVLPVMAPRSPNAASVMERLEQIDSSGWYSNLGPQEQELRTRFAIRLRVPASQIATVANATLGIAGAIAVLGGKRWVAPTFTFVATPAAIVAAGAELIFGDIDPSTWTVLPQSSVDGHVVVAPFGTPPDLNAWNGRGRVVHDAAASLGEELDLSLIPPGQAVIFSLHATKVLGSGEGGIAVFGSAEDAKRFRSWTNFGFAGSREAQFSGVNAKMSEVQAAYVHAALDGWERERAEWVEARSTLVALLDVVGVELFEASRQGINPYMIARFGDESRCAHVEHVLSQHLIETRRWWSRCCHTMPAYRPFSVGPYPASERAAGESLGLPFFRGLRAEHLERLAEGLGAALKPAKRP